MFVSVKERARQIANGQFSAPPSAPVVSLIDLAPEAPKNLGEFPVKMKESKIKKESAKGKEAIKATKESKTTESTVKAKQIVKEPATKTKDVKEPIPAPPATPKTPSKTTLKAPKTPKTPSKTPPLEAPSKKSSKAVKESSKPSSPRIGSKSMPKAPSTSKLASPPKSTSCTAKPASLVKPTKRSKSPPKRVDSPVEDEDPLAALKSACLKHVSGVTGLGGRRLAVVVKQRSSGAWYTALKDTGSDKYLKMWTNRDKTFATQEEALEAYLAFTAKMRNEVRWFPRAGSPKRK